MTSRRQSRGVAVSLPVPLPSLVGVNAKRRVRHPTTSYSAGLALDIMFFIYVNTIVIWYTSKAASGTGISKLGLRRYGSVLFSTCMTLLNF